MRQAAEITGHAGRAVLLMLLTSAGTILLVRFAPGYFSDFRELDARYAQVTRQQLQAESNHPESLLAIARREAESWAHGDLGQSRQYQTPVAALIAERIPFSAMLLAKGILLGWLIAITAALPISGLRSGAVLWGLPFTLIVCVPAAALACILADSDGPVTGGPVLVLTLLIAAREFKFLRSLLHGAWRSSSLLHGRAQGLRLRALISLHIIPSLSPQLGAQATLSIVTALGALLPVEVIFNVPGVGQLAWSAVMNRDLPVLVAVSLLVAAVVALAGMLSAQPVTLEAS